MLIEFTVIADHRYDPSQFLLIGADGQYYEYDPAHELISAVEPDERWEVIPGTQGTASGLVTTDCLGNLEGSKSAL